MREQDVARSKQVCIYVVEALLIAIYLGNDLILVDIRKLSRSRPVSSGIAGPCPAEPLQLVHTQLGPISAGLYQLRACESPPKRGLLATLPLCVRLRPSIAITVCVLT